MIQPTSQSDGYSRMDAITNAAAKNAPAAKTTSETGGDRLSSANTDALREALNNTPEVRPDVVKRGRELAVDLNYPPREIIAQLAKLMLASNDLSDQA